jgi:hypothetical protein
MLLPLSGGRISTEKSVLFAFLRCSVTFIKRGKYNLNRKTKILAQNTNSADLQLRIPSYLFAFSEIGISSAYGTWQYSQLA